MSKVVQFHRKRDELYLGNSGRLQEMGGGGRGDGEEGGELQKFPECRMASLGGRYRAHGIFV